MDGQEYKLEPNQVAPLAIRKREWESGEWRGKYVLAQALTAPYLKWVGK